MTIPQNLNNSLAIIFIMSDNNLIWEYPPPPPPLLVTVVEVLHQNLQFEKFDMSSNFLISYKLN